MRTLLRQIDTKQPGPAGGHLMTCSLVRRDSVAPPRAAAPDTHP